MINLLVKSLDYVEVGQFLAHLARQGSLLSAERRVPALGRELDPFFIPRKTTRRRGGHGESFFSLHLIPFSRKARKIFFLKKRRMNPGRLKQFLFTFEREFCVRPTEWMDGSYSIVSPLPGLSARLIEYPFCDHHSPHPPQFK